MILTGHKTESPMSGKEYVIKANPLPGRRIPDKLAGKIVRVFGWWDHVGFIDALDSYIFDNDTLYGICENDGILVEPDELEKL